MNLRFNINSISSCLPISKSKFEEFTREVSRGELDHVWFTPGHVFISLERGKRLVIFDCVTVDDVQITHSDGYMSLECTSPVISVLSLPSNHILLVYADGPIQKWRYRSDASVTSWHKVSEVNVCTVPNATITSSCLNITHDSLYFCQQQQQHEGTGVIINIYRRQLKDEDKQLSVGTATAVITNCPDCSLYPMGHGILMATRPSGSSQLSVCIVLCTLTSRIELVITDVRTILSDISLFSPVPFRNIILQCMKQLLKKTSNVVCSNYTPSSQTLYQLYDDGTVTVIDSNSKAPVKCVLIDDFNSEGFTTMGTVAGCIYIVYKIEIRVYSISSGEFVCSVQIPEDPGLILGACEPAIGTLHSGVFSNTDIYLIQRCSPRQLSERALLERSHFQTDAVRLAYADKFLRYSYSDEGKLSIDSLKKTWLKNLDTQPTTKLAQTVEPYLAEFWKLENMLMDCLSTPQTIPDISAPDAAMEIQSVLDPKSSMSRSARHAQLTYLAHWFPEEVADTLLSQLNCKDKVSDLDPSQQYLWRCVLSGETTEGVGHNDNTVPLFEPLCHLLYKHKPAKLLTFLQQTQKVWDQKVGVSALFKQRQSVLVYERAVKCLPDPDQSVDLQTAINIHVHILLTSEIEGCFLKAVRLLLRYQCWDICIDLLTDYRDRCKQFNLLYQMVLTSLTQNQKLPMYAERIFPLMPKFNSADLMIKGGHSGMSTEVFAQSSDSVSVGSVRPHLLKTLGHSSSTEDYSSATSS